VSVVMMIMRIQRCCNSTCGTPPCPLGSCWYVCWVFGSVDFSLHACCTAMAVLAADCCVDWVFGSVDFSLHACCTAMAVLAADCCVDTASNITGGRPLHPCVFVLQALEFQAGFPADQATGHEPPISQQQWEGFLRAYRERLKLLRLIANVRECCVCDTFLPSNNNNNTCTASNACL